VISRILSLVLFFLIFLLALVVSKLGSIAMNLLVITDATINAPMNSILISGIIFPWVTEKGGIFGFLVGTVLNAWITIGQKVWGKKYEDFSYEGTIENCTNFINATNIQNYTTELTTSSARHTVSNTNNISRIYWIFYNNDLFSCLFIFDW